MILIKYVQCTHSILLLYITIFSSKKLRKFYNIFLLKILSSQKRGGSRGVSIDSFRLPTPSLMFFLTLKGLIFWFKFHNRFQRLVEKIRGVLFYVTFATKNLKAHCDVARQPLWRYVKDRHRSCNETWRFATDGKNWEYFFQISSGTPRVDTATVAVSDVSPQGCSATWSIGAPWGRLRVFLVANVT